jgi:hypothetical protein
VMIIAYYPIHYGSDYLGYSIKSIYDRVDQIHILYAQNPSHGHGTNLKNPDTFDKLLEASSQFGDPQNKIVWHHGEWPYEGAQRDTINKIASKVNADMILAVDADEIWDENVLDQAITTAFQNNKKFNLIRMLTFWRCFNKVVTDEMCPNRIILPKAEEGTNYLTGRVHHFGYARTIENIEYKMSIHGHKNEWRKEWIDIYKNWPHSRNTDLHPTCENMWTVEDFDKTTLPDFMHQHPYYDLEII